MIDAPKPSRARQALETIGQELYELAKEVERLEFELMRSRARVKELEEQLANYREEPTK